MGRPRTGSRRARRQDPKQAERGAERLESYRITLPRPFFEPLEDLEKTDEKSGP